MSTTDNTTTHATVPLTMRLNPAVFVALEAYVTAGGIDSEDPDSILQVLADFTNALTAAAYLIGVDSFQDLFPACYDYATRAAGSIEKDNAEEA